MKRKKKSSFVNTLKTKASTLILGVIGLIILSFIGFRLATHKASINILTTNSSIPNQTDIVIAGAGTGGIGAALQAAEIGSRVLLIDETDYLGGQMTAAGVTSIDRNDPRYSTGFFRQFETRVRAYYQKLGKSTNTCYYESSQDLCFEPTVGEQILRNMLAEKSNITLLTRMYVASVQKTGNQISAVTLKDKDGRTHVVQTKILIDATEYGDILPLTGVPYRIGNATNTSPNPNACIQDITYLAIMKKYPSGVPSELWIQSPPPGYNQALEAQFAKMVTKNGNPWGKRPVNWSAHNGYRGIPDSSNPQNYTDKNPETITKTGINFANDFPVTTQYLEDIQLRQTINCQAKLKTIQFIYYVQHNLGETQWSVADDENYDTPYNQETNLCPTSIIPTNLKAVEKQLPVMPYVRESRRIIGKSTMTAKDITPNRHKQATADSVAIADYNMDLHGCDAAATLESDLEQSSDRPPTWYAGPFQISLNTLLNETVPNLLVAEKNFSQSRYANSATRLQPSTMAIGQAAGAIAALAVRDKILPTQIPTLEIQRAILQSGSPIVAFNDLDVKNPYFTGIQELAIRGIMRGYGQDIFGVNDSLPRDQLAVMLARSLGLKVNAAQGIFADVPRSYWAAPEIEAMFTRNITSGCTTSPLSYCPSQAVTKAQLATFLTRMMPLLNITLPSLTTQIYQDVNSTHWAYSAIQTMTQMGITLPCGNNQNNFCPEKNVTRGEAAHALNTLLHMSK